MTQAASSPVLTRWLKARFLYPLWRHTYAHVRITPSVYMSFVELLKCKKCSDTHVSTRTCYTPPCVSTRGISCLTSGEPCCIIRVAGVQYVSWSVRPYRARKMFCAQRRTGSALFHSTPGGNNPHEPPSREAGVRT